MKLDDMIVSRTNLPPDEFSAGRNDDYIWRDLWTRPSICNRPVTGSHGFGSSQRLGRCCLWLSALPVRWKGSAEVPQCHHLAPLVSRASHDVDVPVHYPLYRHFLGNVFAKWSNYDLVIILDSPWCCHPVWPDGGSVVAELDMSLYDPCLWVCRQLLAFDPAVLRTPPFFRLILTFSYCLYDFLREQELGTGGSPITDKAVSFHGQIKQAKLNVFAPDSQDAMELLGSQAPRELCDGDMRL